MKILFENWRGFLNEEIEEDDTLDAKIRQALIDEGGAAGMEALEKHTRKNAGDIRARIEEMDDVGEHPNGDYILSGGDVVIKEEQELEEKVDKEKMACNKPRRTSSHKGKSHVVKACEGGKEKIIPFGEKGASTAGKPKKGESKKTKARRKSFKARHGKNIKKGKMSAAFWSNKVKW
tara:strand:+ start:2902 stop:3432 length:531 start_codon:yes stop_codon:yes gene_type:complete